MSSDEKQKFPAKSSRRKFFSAMGAGVLGTLELARQEISGTDNIVVPNVDLHPNAVSRKKRG
ncbi:hypothetical protein HOF92_07715 [bacterium]|jgi:hypothetical protein|nr:hypothetical protein [bacterium]